MAIEPVLLGASLLLLVSVLASKASSRLGVPALLLFLVIGMLAGSEGPGGIAFHSARAAQSLGAVALALILFAGGLETRWERVRPVLWQGVSLSTAGVVATALLVGIFSAWALRLSFSQGLLLGAIVSSTDAAAVFSVLRSSRASLRGNLKPLLELESGSNDPMAVLLTLGMLRVLTAPSVSASGLLAFFALQIVLGAAVGYAVGRAGVRLLNAIRLEYEGLYTALMLSLVLLCYSGAAVLGGSGFLAVYVAGLIFGNSSFSHKKSLVRFHDGLAWLMQIAMFLALGLLVRPSRMLPLSGAGFLVSFFLIFCARPLSVFASLCCSNLDLRGRLLVAWVGLRGAVPIVLATFPLLARLPQAEFFFNLVFFIVLTSTLLQGTTIPLVARFLGVAEAETGKRRYPIEFEQPEGTDMDLVDFIIPFGADAAGKTLVQIGLPPDSLVTLICRNEEFLVPSGTSVLEEGDVVLVLVNPDNLPVVRSLLLKPRPRS